MTGRLLTGTMAWAVGTAIAVTLSWLGAEVVLRDAVASGPQVPVLGPVSPSSPAAAPAPSSSASRPGSPAPSGRKSPSPRPSATPGPLPSRSSPASSPRPGTVRSYALDGGRVTLLIAQTSAQLVTATPGSGFSVQTWSAAGWLRVDFSQGSSVSSLIATWNGHAPTVQIFND
jgi:hypothetical protein